MRRDLVIFWRSVRAENRMFWRSPVGAFFTLGLPLVMLVLFVALFGNEPIDHPEYGDITTAQFYAPGLGVFAAASATFTNIAINLSMRRDDGVLKRVRGTPIPPWVFLGGVIVSAVWIAVCATIVMLGLGVLAYGVEVQPEQLPVLVVSFVVGAVCFATLGVALASVARTAGSAPAMANATILPMAFISDVFIPLETPPSWLVRAGDVLPLKPFAVSFSEAMSPFAVTPALAWDRIAVLVVWTVAGALIARKMFRWEPVPGATKRRRRRNRSIAG